MKLFYKEKKPNGRRHIYVCGVKVFSYSKHNHDKNIVDMLYGQFCPSVSPVEYIKSLGVKVGKNFKPIIHPYPWSYPDFGSEPWFIEIGDDVCISFGCTFLTHDASVRVVTRLQNDKNLILQKYGKIKIGNNCFIGCNTTIMPNVTIGDNSIVGAGSVVTKNIPSGEIWAGNPAHFVSTIEKYSKKTIALFHTPEQQELRKIVHKTRNRPSK